MRSAFVTMDQRSRAHYIGMEDDCEFACQVFSHCNLAIGVMGAIDGDNIVKSASA